MRRRMLAGVVLSMVVARGALGARRAEVDLSGAGWRVWKDEGAAWKEDALFLPPVDLGKVPVNKPTGEWEELMGKGVAAAVPGTAEEYLQTVAGPAGDLTGVTWWTREVEVPVGQAGARVLLQFEAARQRAEVYVNRKLVGYDLVGNTPFEADLTGVAKPGEKVELAVRITDPGGNFDWHDKGLIAWGENKLLNSHGFGGITGRMRLIVCEPVYVDDLAVENTPEVRTVHAKLRVKNTTGAAVTRDVVVRVVDVEGKEVARDVVRGVVLKAGENAVGATVAAPGVKLWDVEHPNLYFCRAAIEGGAGDGDEVVTRFGFRWFAPVGIGSDDAHFELNGKRIVLRSAISWGFFPINGIYATPEMAEKQIRTAKSLGLNMLNFHRCIGQPVILEKADELGLLYYEEPGNYDNGADDRNVMARGMAKEKVARMVVRDRSHPSLIVYNMSNETGPSPAMVENYVADMQVMHALDPSRVITRSSGLRSTPGMDKETTTKIHMRPFDDTVYRTGWYDDHHAGGPAVWMQSLYKSPTDFYHGMSDPKEIVYWGEEGAISTPPRLGLIKEELLKEPRMGWDGAMYLDWYKTFDAFIDAKGLRGGFATVDALCESMGNISLEHQGRKTQLMRINNETDGYATNGWESEILENHSGIVDCFRNPKGDPGIMAYYNQSLYVAVMPRKQVVAAGGKFVADFFLVNEKDVKGELTLQIEGKDAAGKVMIAERREVKATGGNVYGELLTQGVEVSVSAAAGMFHVSATLRDGEGNVVGTGRDEVLVVDWVSDKIGGAGAVLEDDTAVRDFLRKSKGVAVDDYGDATRKVDWVAVASTPDALAPVIVPTTALRDVATGRAGLRATFFGDGNVAQRAVERVDATVDLAAAEGAPPDAGVNSLGNYSVRWEGEIVPPATGEYAFFVKGTGTAAVRVNGTALEVGARAVPKKGEPALEKLPATVRLEAGHAVAVVVEWKQGTGDAACRLLWKAPLSVPAPSAEKLLDRVENDGTTLVVLEHAAAWMERVAKRAPAIHYAGAFTVGTTWAGGDHFVKAHRLFEGLPVDGGMNWPYQAVVRDGNARIGLMMEGEEFVAGAFHANTPLSTPPSPMRLGTAVGIVRVGKGRVIFSTLDIVSNLSAAAGPADVARKVLCNFLKYAGER